MRKGKPHGSSLKSNPKRDKAVKNTPPAFMNMVADQGITSVAADNIGPVLEQVPTETYEPPYPWALTGSVGCTELRAMIADVEQRLLSARMVPQMQEVWNKWLNYARERLSTMKCPEGKDIYVEPDTINPPPILPIFTADDVPHAESPIKTAITAPPSSPYPVMVGGAGGGGSTAAQPVKKSRTWIWLAVAATATVGYFLFKK